MQKTKYKNLSEEKKEAKREYQRNSYKNMTEDKKNKTKRISKKLVGVNKIKY